MKTPLCSLLLPFSSQTRFAGLCSEDGGSKEVRAIPFPPCGENSIMLSPSSFFLANPLRWALLGVRGSKEVRTIPFPPCGENCTMLAPSSFFLANPLRWALLGVREVGRAFRLDGLRHICASKNKNRTKIHRCQVQSSFGEAEKRPDDEKAAGNTLCISKVFEDVWTFFCSSKPCMSLSTDGNINR